jgi:hypothetical protein
MPICQQNDRAGVLARSHMTPRAIVAAKAGLQSSRRRVKNFEIKSRHILP